MEYITTKQASEKWGISQRRVRILCQQNRITGVVKAGKSFLIPITATKPNDNRYKILPLNEVYAKIDNLKKQLQNKRPFTISELERLQEDFIIEYTYNTNAIEGNTLSLKETSLVLQGLTIDKKPLIEHLEVIQHKDAFYYIVDLVSQGYVLTETIIRQIHSIVLNHRPDARGTYRQIEVRIGGTPYVPPHPMLIKQQMSDLLRNYHSSTINLIKRIAIFHLDFERIHPFIDGNGRTGRLIANLELMKYGFPPIDIKFEDRLNYYECFADFEMTNSTEKIERLFASYVLERLEHYLKILG